MSRTDLRLYDGLSRLGRPKSYEGKIMLMAFIGTHVPLLATVVYAIKAALTDAAKVRIILTTLIATLVGTALTLYALHRLLAPITRVSRDIRSYLDHNKKPGLPTHYTDQAGRLMADTRFAIEKLDAVIRDLEELSMRDHLTGLYNRRSGESRLEEDIARSRRNGQPLSLAVLDMNHFKQINDEHGHTAGDKALKHVAGIIADGIRAGDWAARWGGDEFMIGFLGLDEEQACATMQRLQEVATLRPLDIPGEEPITLSFNVGIRQHEGADDARELFRKTDAALIAQRDKRRKEEAGVY